MGSSTGPDVTSSVTFLRTDATFVSTSPWHRTSSQQSQSLEILEWEGGISGESVGVSGKLPGVFLGGQGLFIAVQSLAIFD